MTVLRTKKIEREPVRFPPKEKFQWWLFPVLAIAVAVAWATWPSSAISQEHENEITLLARAVLARAGIPHVNQLMRIIERIVDGELDADDVFLVSSRDDAEQWWRLGQAHQALVTAVEGVRQTEHMMLEAIRRQQAGEISADQASLIIDAATAMKLENVKSAAMGIVLATDGRPPGSGAD